MGRKKKWERNEEQILIFVAYFYTVLKIK